MHKRGPCCRKMAGWLFQKVLDCRLLIKDRQQKGVSLNILPDPMNFWHFISRGDDVFSNFRIALQSADVTDCLCFNIVVQKVI